MPKRLARAEGFFIDDLVGSLLGEEAFDPLTEARPFFSRRVLSHLSAIREAFSQGGRVLHVCLDGVLKPRVAKSIGAALSTAPFRRHHHAPYRIDVAPLDVLPTSTLSRFCAFLGSDEGAAFHQALSGWPPEGHRLTRWQVQVARARRGDEFPVHVDTNQEGLACVYHFTRGFSEADGGVLSFPHRGRAELSVAPAFNRLILFRPKGAPHGVSRVRAPKGRSRFTVTVFYLYRRR
ncbi:MAG: 2OG-Fe(II) oxygenase [Myxococcota bacterium]